MEAERREEGAAAARRGLRKVGGCRKGRSAE